MANRYFSQFYYTLDKAVCNINGRVSFGATGAPTLVTSSSQSKGLVSVTRSTTGRYVFVFGTNGTPVQYDTYNLYQGLQVAWDASANSGTAPATCLVYIYASAITTAGTASITVQCLDFAAAPVDPGNGDVGNFIFVMRNSNAP